MTDWIDISDTTPRIAYTATAGQTLFTVPFVFFADNDLQVYQNGTLLVLDTDYTVDGAEDENGGSITMLLTVAASDEIMIVREVAIEQTSHFPPSGPLDVAALNIQLSKLIAIDQQLQELIGRTIRLDEGTAGSLDIADPVANEYLKWNATADGIESTAIVTSAGSYAVATESEARAGTSNTTLMTPLRTAQVLESRIWTPSGYLSLSSTATIPTSDITGANAVSINYIDTGGGGFPTYSAADARWTWREFSGALQALFSSNAAHVSYQAALGNCDVYGAYHPSIGPFIGLTATGGTDFAGRGSAISDITVLDGIKVNSLAQNLRFGTGANDYLTIAVNEATYLGSAGMVAAGQSEDSLARRLVFNAYNGHDRWTRQKYAGISYARNSATTRQVAGDATMQTEILLGLSGILVEGEAQHYAVLTVAPGTFFTGIALGAGSTTNIASTESFGEFGLALNASSAFPATFRFKSDRLGVGRKTFVWTEDGVASGCTFQQASSLFKNGIQVVGRSM